MFDEKTYGRRRTLMPLSASVLMGVGDSGVSKYDSLRNCTVKYRTFQLVRIWPFFSCCEREQTVNNTANNQKRDRNKHINTSLPALSKSASP